MTAGQRRAWLYGVLAVGVTLGGWALLRGVPAWRRTAQLTREQAALAEEADGLAQPGGGDLAALERELDALRARREALLGAELPHASGAQLDAALAHLAEGHGLLVESSEARQPTAQAASGTPADEATGARRRAGGLAAAVGRRITLRGSFGALRAFLAGLADLPAPPVVSRLAVAHADVGGLRIELEITP